jgi:hypothetical protein
MYETVVFCGMTSCTLVNLQTFWRSCLHSEGFWTTVKIELKIFSETSVNIHESMRRHVTEDCSVHQHRRENC